MMKTRIVIAAVAAICFSASAMAADPAPAAKPAATKPMAPAAKQMPAAAKPMTAAAKPMTAAAKPMAAKPLPKRAVGDNSATKPGAKPRTAISLDCSKQADAKGLHGKPREKFRDQCKKAGK